MNVYVFAKKLARRNYEAGMPREPPERFAVAMAVEKKTDGRVIGLTVDGRIGPRDKFRNVCGDYFYLFSREEFGENEITFLIE